MTEINPARARGQAMTLWLEGVPVYDIARKTGLTPDEVRQTVRLSGNEDRDFE